MIIIRIGAPSVARWLMRPRDAATNLLQRGPHYWLLAVNWGFCCAPFLPPTARLPHRHVSVLAREPLHFRFFSFHFLPSAGRLSVFFRLRDTVWHITSAFYVDAVAVFLGRGSAGLNRRSRPMPFVHRGAAPRWRFREKRHRSLDRN